MEWSALFGFVNLVALIAWAALILLPRWPALLSGCLYVGSGLLCLIYAVCIVGVLTGVLNPAGPPESGGMDFSSIEGVRSILASDAGVTIGWTHYLAFDLFVGVWIARDADHKGFSRFLQAPVLLLTFLAGPVGLLIWLIIRESRARKQGRWT